MRKFTLVAAAIAFAVGVLVGISGCASPGGLPGPVPGPDERVDLGKPGAQIASYDDVRFYPACGNETLAHDGKVWFPFHAANPEYFPMVGVVADDATAAARGYSGGGAASGFGTVSASIGMVVAPGPGDDVGTLTVYEKDLAYWLSDSGDLDTWLTTTKLEYTWAC